MWPPPQQGGWWTGPRWGRWFWFWWKPCGCRHLLTRSWLSSRPSSRKGGSPGGRRSAWVTVPRLLRPLKQDSKHKRWSKWEHRDAELTHNFPVPPCWPVGSSRCRSPPLEYISTTCSKTKKRNTPIKYQINPTLISWSTQKQANIYVKLNLNYLQWLTVRVVDVYERWEAAVHWDSGPDEGPQSVGVWDTNPKNLQGREVEKQN